MKIFTTMQIEDLQLDKIDGIEILGVKVVNFKKIHVEDESSLKKIDTSKLDEILYFYDMEGIKHVYNDNYVDKKHYVRAMDAYKSNKENEMIIAFDVDSYSKFCYMFKKRGFVIQPTC